MESDVGIMGILMNMFMGAVTWVMGQFVEATMDVIGALVSAICSLFVGVLVFVHISRRRRRRQRIARQNAIDQRVMTTPLSPSHITSL